MKKYIVRPYFGSDCDSENGFNNGYYLDDIEVMANNETTAIEKAMSQYIKNNDIDLEKVEINGYFGDNTIYHEYAHKENTETNESSYLYQYVDFNEIVEGYSNDPIKS